MNPITQPVERRDKNPRSFMDVDPEEERRNKELTLRNQRPVAVRGVTVPLERHRQETYKPGNPSSEDNKVTWADSQSKNVDGHLIDIHSTGKDVSVHLDIDVQIDFSEDVAELARLNRLGWFNEGTRLYEEKLKDHIDFFPIAAEYADLLLKQGKYEAATKFISECLLLQEESSEQIYASDEEVVLRSMKAYAEIFCQGSLKLALDTIQEASDLLRKERTDSVKGTKIHMMELYLQIVSFAEFNSEFVLDVPPLNTMHFIDGDSWIIFPFTPLPSNEFGKWYHILRHHGFYWEAHRILHILFSILEHKVYLYNDPIGVEHRMPVTDVFTGLMRIRRMEDLAQSFMKLEHVLSHGDEQLILAEFADASLIGHFLAVSMQEYPQAANDCLDRVRNLATVIINKYPHMSTSRPFLEWMLREQSRQLPVSIRRYTPQVDSLSSSTHRGHVKKLPFQSYMKVRSTDYNAAGGQKSKDQHFESLQRMLRNAEKLGDFLLQRSILREMIDSDDSNSISERLEACEKLAYLELNLMVDLVGYIECLTAQYVLIESLPLPDDQVKAKEKLCEKIRSFDRVYPSYYDMPARFGKVPLFHIPLTDYLKKQVYIRLLSDLHCDKERLIVEAQLQAVEEDVPVRFKGNHTKAREYSRDRYDRYASSENDSESEWHRPRRRAHEHGEIPVTSYAYRRRSEASPVSPPRPQRRAYDYGELPITSSGYRRPLEVSPPRRVTIRRQSSLDTFDRPEERIGYTNSHEPAKASLVRRNSRPRSPLRTEEDYYKEIRIAEPDYYEDDDFRRFGVHRPFDQVVYEKSYPRKGRTHIPGGRFRKLAIIELGYPFVEEKDMLVVQRALSVDQVNEVISLSEVIKHQREHKRKEEADSPPEEEEIFVSVYEENVSESDINSTRLPRSKERGFVWEYTDDRHEHEPGRQISISPPRRKRHSPPSTSISHSIPDPPAGPPRSSSDHRGKRATISREDPNEEVYELPWTEESQKESRDPPATEKEGPNHPSETPNEDTTAAEQLNRQPTVEPDNDGTDSSLY